MHTPHSISVDPPKAHAAQTDFIDFVMAPTFPCVGARSAVNRKRMRFATLPALAATDTVQPLLTAIYAFLDEFKDPGIDPVTFIASFDSSATSEEAFERAMWQQLQQLHESDRDQFEWDSTVSSDPNDPHFSFSLGGRGMFVVGLHPMASRIARRAPRDTLVFNLHGQFEQLRKTGKYASMQRAIRNRDMALQGSINPVLARFGEASEALQYSGRASPSKCPFHMGVKT